MNTFFLEKTTQKYKDLPAVIDVAGTHSYADFTHSVLAAAERLSARGFQAGDRIGIISSPSRQTLAAIMAILRIGGVVVPMNTRFPAQQIATMLGYIKCRSTIVSQEYAQHIADTVPSFLLLEELTADTSSTPQPQPWPGSRDHDATIVCTSGSTGMPKAVLHTLNAHLCSALGSQQNIPLGPGDCWLLSLPLFHVGGFAVPVRAFLAGASVALPAPGTSVAEALRRFPITHLSLVATQLYRLLRDNEHVELLRRLNAILLGGSAIPRTLIDQALDAGLRIHTSYGCTEMASQVTTTRATTADELSTSGRVLPGREVTIAGSGEILVRGATLFRGYVEGNTIRSAVDEEGWYHTRDIGFLDSSGLLHITGRMDNMFISGGENIQPEEIEQALCRIPGILQSLVVPVADEEFGARPIAFIWPADDTPFDEAHVHEQLARHIARFKLPVRFIIEPPLQESAGKLSREEYKRKAQEL